MGTLTALTALTALVVLLLAGCSDEEPGTSTSPPSPSSTAGLSEPSSASTRDGAASPSTPGGAATTSPYLPVPDGVGLTMQGADLRLGDTATVAWKPRRHVVGALDITVTALQRARLVALSAFRLEPAQRESSLFYVRGTVRNVGETDLAGVDIPLYAVNGRDLLIEATPFAATFKPCPSAPLPKPFTTGRRTRFCLVFLVPEHGALKAVSFRPTQEYDPITWVGRIRAVQQARQ